MTYYLMVHYNLFYDAILHFTSARTAPGEVYAPRQWRCQAAAQETITIFLMSLLRLDVEASSSPAKCFRADIGGHEITLHHSPWPAEEVGQAVGDAGRGVARSLLRGHIAAAGVK